MVRYFIYGTLKKGFYNYDSLNFDKNARFICNGKIKGKIFDLGAYPCVVLGEEGEVYGEIYELNEETGEKVDAMEKGAGYSLKKVKAISDNGEIEVLVYVYDDVPKNGKLIEEGKWSKK